MSALCSTSVSMSSNVATTIDYIARGIALLQSSQLVNSIVNSQGGMACPIPSHPCLLTKAPGAKQFLGLPHVSPEALTFFPPLGARNATIGLTAFILSLRGERVGVATTFLLSCIPGIVDAWTCVRRGGNWQVHIAASGMLMVVAGLLVRYAQK